MDVISYDGSSIICDGPLKVDKAVRSPGKGGRKKSAGDDVPADLKVAFAENLRRAREEVGISQADLSRLTGVSTKHLSHVEHAKAKNLSLRTIAILAKGIGKTVADLLTIHPRKN